MGTACKEKTTRGNKGFFLFSNVSVALQATED